MTAKSKPDGVSVELESALGGVFDRAECKLLSELGVAVAKGRLDKACRRMSNLWIDPNSVAVELCSILEPSVAYPNNNRYPLAGRRSTVVHLDGDVGATIVWSMGCTAVPWYRHFRFY